SRRRRAVGASYSSSPATSLSVWPVSCRICPVCFMSNRCRAITVDEAGRSAVGPEADLGELAGGSLRRSELCLNVPIILVLPCCTAVTGHYRRVTDAAAGEAAKTAKTARSTPSPQTPPLPGEGSGVRAHELARTRG